jgi:hypothetical protein
MNVCFALFTDSKEPLPNKFLEDDLDVDDLEEMMEGLQFDLDGFLDLDQFDFDEVSFKVICFMGLSLSFVYCFRPTDTEAY